MHSIGQRRDESLARAARRHDVYDSRDRRHFSDLRLPPRGLAVRVDSTSIERACPRRINQGFRQDEISNGSLPHACCSEPWRLESRRFLNEGLSHQ